jgi:hypothetical protein
MDLKERLLELLDGVDFRFDTTVQSPAELKKMADYNLAEYDKFKAMGEEHMLRTQDVIGAILSDLLQPLAIKEYGTTDNSAIRAILHRELSRPEIRANYQRVKQLAVEGILAEGVCKSQRGKVAELVDCAAHLYIEFVLEVTGRWRLLPRSESSRLIGVLTEMFKEGNHADSIRHTQRQEETAEKAG